MTTSQEQRNEQIFERVLSIEDEELQSLLFARIIGPKLVEMAAPTVEAYTWLVQQLLRMLRRPYIAEYASAYSLRCWSQMRVAINAHLPSEPEEVAERGKAWVNGSIFEPSDVKIIYVRREPWGGITAFKADWDKPWPFPMVVKTLRFTLRGEEMVTFQSQSDYRNVLLKIAQHGDSHNDGLNRHSTLAFPEAETLPCLRKEADAEFGAQYEAFPLPSLALLLIDAVGAHRMSHNEWVIGLQNRGKYLQWKRQRDGSASGIHP